MHVPQFCYTKVGFKGVFITRTCFPVEASLFQIMPLHVLVKSVFKNLQYFMPEIVDNFDVYKFRGRFRISGEGVQV